MAKTALSERGRIAAGKRPFIPCPGGWAGYGIDGVRPEARHQEIALTFCMEYLNLQTDFDGA